MNTQDKNTQKQEILNAEQSRLVAELSALYGIDPDQVIFFTGDPQPFFEHEAAAVLVRYLAGARGIKNMSVESKFPDTIAMYVEIAFEDGFTSGAEGYANVNELLNGQKMTEDQLRRMATGRAMRTVLVDAGVNLLKLHHKAMHRAVDDAPERSNRSRLIARAHALGSEMGLIVNTGEGIDKTLWQGTLTARYGVTNSNELGDDLLADFVAFLNTLAPQTRQKAA